MIQTLSIISSSLPHLQFVSIAFLFRLLTATDVLKTHDTDDTSTHTEVSSVYY